MTVTGAHELNIEALRIQLQSMTATSGCCASGTCPVRPTGKFAGEVISEQRDVLDAFAVAVAFGEF